MKKITYLLSLLVLTSCSSDDDAPTEIQTQSNYFPLVVGNQWNYSNTSEDYNGTSDSNETLNVEDEILVNNIEKYQLISTVEEANVSITSILSTGLVYKQNGKMFLSGNFNFSLEEESNLPDLGIDFEDLVIYDENATQGSILFDLDEGITLPEFNNITISATIQIQSKSLGNLELLEVNGVTFEDVISSSITVKIGVTASAIVPPLPIPITVAIFDNQEVIASTNYFANQVGLIKSETTLNIEFNDLGTFFPLELDNIFTQFSQEITNYEVQLETE